VLVTLLGTGDTTGTPTVGCDCETCETARERNIERTRFSVHIENDRTGESLLIDFSPDFRYQFLRDGVSLPDAAIVTHIHFDHLDGLGNVFRLVDSLDIYAADETDPVTGKSVAETVQSDYDYLSPIEVHPTTPYDPIRICGFDVTLVPVVHPPLVCYGVVVEDPETGAKLSVTGDTNYEIPDLSREVFADPDLLLADGIVPAALCDHHPIGGCHENADGVPRTFGTKHMTREGALELADELGAKRTRLVHIAHYYSADEAFEEPLAIDGEQYQLS